MLVTTEEMKNYLRVDTTEDDSLIAGLITYAQKICMDIARIDTEDELTAVSDNAKTAVMYAAAYLYEHREEADHKAMTLTLRALLFGVRNEAF